MPAITGATSWQGAPPTQLEGLSPCPTSKVAAKRTTTAYAAFLASPAHSMSPQIVPGGIRSAHRMHSAGPALSSTQRSSFLSAASPVKG